MKNKGLIIAAVVVICVIGIVLMRNNNIFKMAAKKAPAVVKGAPAPVKKVFSKDMGGLTVKVATAKNKDAMLGVRAFKVIDKRSSEFAAGFNSNRMKELAPGNYDIEIDTVPQKLYKDITVNKGKETIEDLGSITGAVDVKALNAAKKNASLLVRILYPKSSISVTTTTTNRSVEILPGVYDIEIATMPRQVRKDVKINAGNETVIDLGCVSGTINVKAMVENKAETRVSFRVRNPANNEIVATGTTNRPLELGGGTYDIELLSKPVQTRKSVKVTVGEETAVEFIVEKPAIVQKKGA